MTTRLYMVLQQPRAGRLAWSTRIWFTNATSKADALRAYAALTPPLHRMTAAGLCKPTAELVVAGGDVRHV